MKKKRLTSIWERPRNSRWRMDESSNEDNGDLLGQNQTNHTTQWEECLQNNSKYPSCYSPVVQSENHSKVSHGGETAICLSFIRNHDIENLLCVNGNLLHSFQKTMFIISYKMKNYKSN